MPRVLLVNFDLARLVEATDIRGFTATQLAARAGCSVETVRAALKGRPIGETTAKAIARAVGVGLRSLLAGQKQATEAA